MKLIELEVQKVMLGKELQNPLFLHEYTESKSEVRVLEAECRKRKETYCKNLKVYEDLKTRLHELFATTYISVLDYKMSLSTAKEYVDYYNRNYRQEENRGNNMFSTEFMTCRFGEIKKLPILNYYDSVKYAENSIRSNNDNEDCECILVDPFNLKNSNIQSEINKFYEVLLAEYTKALASVEA